MSLVEFLDKIMSTDLVPSYLYQEGESFRVTSIINTRDYNTVCQKCRFNEMVTKGLSQRVTAQKHTKVLKTILEEDKNAIASELPLWSEAFYYPQKFSKVVGHNDLISYYHPYIYIWDFKPSNDPLVGDQVEMYKQLLLGLIIGLKSEDIVTGWFSEDYEWIVQDKSVKLFEKPIDLTFTKPVRSIKEILQSERV